MASRGGVVARARGPDGLSRRPSAFSRLSGGGTAAEPRLSSGAKLGDLPGPGHESFNGKLRDELLDREVFHSLREAQVLIEAWRQHYNMVRPHSALGYRPPAPEGVARPAWPPSRPAAGQGAHVVYH
jgi:hypothetical protein